MYLHNNGPTELKQIALFQQAPARPGGPLTVTPSDMQLLWTNLLSTLHQNSGYMKPGSTQQALSGRGRGDGRSAEAVLVEA